MGKDDTDLRQLVMIRAETYIRTILVVMCAAEWWNSEWNSAR